MTSPPASPATVYWTGGQELTLAEALAIGAAPGAVGLLSTPTRYHVTVVTGDGRCETADGAVDLTSVFEARVFDQDRELRWLHHDDGRGDSVVLAEDRGLLPDGAVVEQLTALDTNRVDYVLWGSAVAAGRDGWVRLRQDRISGFAVPCVGLGGVPVAAGSRLALTAVEYFAVPETDRHGNVAVVEERLVRIGVNNG